MKQKIVLKVNRVKMEFEDVQSACWKRELALRELSELKESVCYYIISI
jgi:hypothetical protein